FTIWVTPDEALLVLKFPSPSYEAVIEWLPPTDSEFVVNAAWPEPLTGMDPRVVSPSLNVMVPVSVPAPGVTTLTVAVKVTDWAETDEFGDEVTDVVVFGLFTSGAAPEEVLVLKFPSPAYAAVIEWPPKESDLVVVNVAWPELSVPVPSVV